jgi:predicted GNAT superfamily acetyltransferase
MYKNPNIEIREINEFVEFDACLDLQRKVFKFSELDVSPRRHHVVTKHAGGFTLGAFDGEKLVGLALTIPAFRGDERIFYSHMAAVLGEYQSFGVGASLKWSQREKALEKGIKFIKWTFQPVQARNAYFNLEKLGAVVRQYKPNFYGIGFSNAGEKNELESDRLFAEWELESEKVCALSKGENYFEKRKIVKSIEIPNDWNDLVNKKPGKAFDEQNRIKEEFRKAFAENLIAVGFEKNETHPKFLLVTG